MQEKLFVYGNLMNTKIQQKVIKRVIKGISSTLKGYKKSKIRIEGKSYPIIIPKKNSSVNGLIISVTAKDLKLIDNYETNAYKRKKVVLGNGKEVWVYLK